MSAPGGDGFEAKEMRDGAPVLHRDKMVARGMAGLMVFANLFVWVMGGVVAAGNSTASKPLPASAIPLFLVGMFFFGLMFTGLGIALGVVRTVVTESALHVKMGLWGPKIPLTNITSAKVVDYKWLEFGGWGIRRGRDGTWAYVPGGKRVLEVKYVEDGKERRMLAAGDNPDETVRQIERARVRVAPALEKTRVEDDTAGAIDEAEDAAARGAKR